MSDRSVIGHYELGKIEGAEFIADVARFPKSYQEAPDLAALVQQGTLPPVGERIGRDPLVLKPVHDTGKYGGTLRRAFRSGQRSGPDEELFASGPDRWLWIDYTYTTLVPNIARGFELSDDATTLTILLRRGMRWSDGAPFTSDDVLFWYQDIYLNAELIPIPHPRMQLHGEPIVIEVVDRHAFRFVSPGPNPLLPRILATRCGISGHASDLGGADGMGGYAPKHYLSQFHPNFATGGQAAVDEMAAEAGFADWAAFFKSRNDWTQNADLPVVTPWKVVEGNEKHTQNFVLERNPFSIWVDTEGNQLPYIDRISMSAAESSEVINERAAAGKYDFQTNSLWFSRLDVFRENEATGGYQTHISPSEVNITGIRLNLAYEADPIIGDLLRTADFRRALALGVDRDQIRRAFFDEMAAPASVAPGPNDRHFPGNEYRTLWATTDVARANEMLDGLGLDQKDADGYRRRSDGKRLRLESMCVVSYADFPAMAEMVKEQWKRIGIEMILITEEMTVEQLENLDVVRPDVPVADWLNANLMQIAVFGMGSQDVFIYPDEVFASSMDGFSASYGPPFVRWFQTRGREGTEPPADLREVMELWHKGFTAPEAERDGLGKQIFKILVEQVIAIGLVGGGIGDMGLFVARTNLGNVPARVVNALPGPLNTFPMTFYFMGTTDGRVSDDEAQCAT